MEQNFCLYVKFNLEKGMRLRMISNQAYIFIIFVIVGGIIGIIFDFFRILRKTIKTKDFMTYLEDILFCIITGIIVLYSIFFFNNGEFRMYMFIGILIGVLMYLLTICPYIIKINVYILRKIIFICKKIAEFLILPFRLIYKGISKIFKPIKFIIINVRRKVYKKVNKIKKIIKKYKKPQK